MNGRPILLIQTAFLGDLLLSGTLLREIRRARPKSPIHLICRKGFGTLMKGLGLVDEVHEIEKGRAKSYAKIFEQIKDIGFEWVICPHPSVRSALFTAKLKAGQSVSFRKWWNLILFSKLVSKADLPDPLRQAALLAPLVPGFEDKVRAWEEIDWNHKDARGFLTEVPEELTLDRRTKLGGHSPIAPVAARTIALFPGSVWATKQWPEEHFAALAEKLIAADYQVLWMGGKDEAAVCDRLAAALPRSRSLAGQTSLWDTLVILARVDAVIANDSGGQHLAAVAGAPVLSIYGPTVLQFGFRPWTRTSMIAERSLFCRPCGPHGDKKCPRGTHECLRELLPEVVFGLFLELSRKIRQRPHR